MVLMIRVLRSTPKKDGEEKSILKCFRPTQVLGPTIRKSWKARVMPAMGAR